MATYSGNLKLTLLGTGEGSGTWGDTTNTNLGTLLEQAISGYATQAIADGADTTITIPDGATGVARNMVIECTGTLTAARNLIVPSNRKLYFVYNNTTGGYAVTVKVSGQTGVSVPNGAKMVLMSNGTDIVEATNYVTFADGTAAAPSITNTGDSNTGIYFPTDDTVGVSTSGTEHMRIDSSGNVGIGTSSPLQRLNVANASITGGGPASSGSAADPNAVSRFQAGAVIMDFGAYAAGQMWIQNRAASNYAINYDLILQPNGGNVGIGISNPPYKLTVSDAGNAGFEFDPTLATPLLQCYDRTALAYKDMQTSAHSLRFNTGTSPAERMRIDSSGNVGIGTSSPIGKFHAVATIFNQSGVTGSGLGTGYGVVGVGGNTAGGHGVSGQGGTGAGSHGVVGQGGGVGGYGVLGTGSTSGGYGVLGVAGNSSYGGVYGQAANGSIYGILAHANFYSFYGVGTLYNNGKAYIAGSADQGAYNVQCFGSGVWGAGAYVNGSDERIKQDIEPINSALPIINALEPVTFKYKSEYSKDQNVQPGFIAQQLKAVMANETYVDGVVQKGPEYLNVAYQSLVPLLTKAIQEQQAIIESLKARLDAANL
jgi:hypothetical protein